MDKEKSKSKVTYLPKTVENRPLLLTSGQKPTKYNIGKLLGSGGFAQCYHATQVESKRQYALKIINKTSQAMLKKGSKQRLANEISIMTRMQHPNIIKFYSSFQDQHNYYLVLELCKKQTLAKLVSQRKYLTELEIKYYIRQLVTALLYLKQKKIIHRDIKLQNILLDQNLNLKLADFGLAVYQGVPNDGTVCGTPCYIAPEIVNRGGYSWQVDMWAVGVVTYILFYYSHPFSASNPSPKPKSKKKQDLDQYQKQCHNLIYQKIKKIDYKFSNTSKVPLSLSARDFISRIFVLNPKERLSVEEALSHQFLIQMIPQYLPLECYSADMAEQELIGFCKQERPPSIKKYRQIRDNRVGNNRTITSYLIRNDGREKSVFRNKTHKKTNKFVGNILDQISGLNQQYHHNGTQQRKVECQPSKTNQKQTKQKQLLSAQKPIPQPQQQQHSQQFSCSSSSSSQPSPQPQKLATSPVPMVDAFGACPQPQYYFQSPPTPSSSSQPQTHIASYHSPHEFLSQKLQCEPYIVHHRDYGVNRGVCVLLNNGIYVAYFYDTTALAYDFSRKIVIFVQYHKSNQLCKRLLYKLVRDINILQNGKNQKEDTKDANLASKYVLRKSDSKQVCQTKLVPAVNQYKTCEIPQFLLDKFQMLKLYTKQCPNPFQLNLPNLPEQLACSGQNICPILLRSCTLVQRFAYKPRCQQYMFWTQKYIQIIFYDRNCYFQKQPTQSQSKYELKEEWFVNFQKNQVKEFKNIEAKSIQRRQVVAANNFVQQLYPPQKNSANRQRKNGHIC